MMKIKNIIVVVLFVLCGLTFTQHPVFAHFLASNGSISTILHLNPDDDPYTLQSTTFFLQFQDSKSQFNAYNCACQAEIDEGSTMLATVPLTATGADAMNGVYTFPQKDVYVMKVMGSPTNGASFQPFTITYDVRVDHVGTASADTTAAQSESVTGRYIGYVVIGGVLLLIVVIGVLIKLFRKKKVA